MKRIEDIDRYLRAYFAAEHAASRESDGHVPLPFVTISRQAGTGGHALADVMLEVFAGQPDTSLFRGWQVFDKSLCEIVAGDRRFATSLASLREEEYRSKATDFFHQMLHSTVDQDLLMERVFLVVRSIAGMGKAIIVGRGGSHVTKDMRQGVSLRMVAPERQRMERLMHEHGLSEKGAIALGKRREADRARLLRRHFGADIEDPTGYDLTCNSGTTTYVEIAEAVASLVRLRSAPG